MNYKELEYCIYFFLPVSILFYLGFRRMAVETIEETGTNSRLYPKHFIAPKRWMKKFFNIKDRVIPKYLYFLLLLSLFFLTLAPVSVVLCIVFKSNVAVPQILFIILLSSEFIGFTSYLVMSLLFKKNKTKPEK